MPGSGGEGNEGNSVCKANKIPRACKAEADSSKPPLKYQQQVRPLFLAAF